MISILMSASVGVAVEEEEEEERGLEEEEEEVVSERFSGLMRAPPPRLTTSPVLFTRIRSSFTARTLTMDVQQNHLAATCAFFKEC
jgi:hypothetical protein